MLLVPDVSLECCHMTKTVCAVNCMWFGAFSVSMCILEFVLIKEQLRQVAVDPKQWTMPVEGGRNSEGRLVMGDSFLSCPRIDVHRQGCDVICRAEIDHLSLRRG